MAQRKQEGLCGMRAQKSVLSGHKVIKRPKLHFAYGIMPDSGFFHQYNASG